MAKSDHEREALSVYYDQINRARYDLALDEAVSSTIYTMAFVSDKHARLENIKRARRKFTKFCKGLDENSKANALRERDANEFLSIEVCGAANAKCYIYN